MVGYIHFLLEVVLQTGFYEMPDFVDEDRFLLPLIEENICVKKQLLLANRPGKRFIAEQ